MFYVSQEGTRTERLIYAIPSPIALLLRIVIPIGKYDQRRAERFRSPARQIKKESGRMYSEQDLHSLYDFLRATAEGNLKKMIVNGRMTEAHLRLFVKIARAGSASEFAAWAQGGGFPKIKMSAPEQALRETFWAIALEACANLGLLGNEVARAA
jgi:hypothetical protein